MKEEYELAARRGEGGAETWRSRQGLGAGSVGVALRVEVGGGAGRLTGSNAGETMGARTGL